MNFKFMYSGLIALCWFSTQAVCSFVDDNNTPEWFSRGSCRMVLSVDSQDIYQGNIAQAGINLYRTNLLHWNNTPEEDNIASDLIEYYSRMGVNAIDYSSPTDCFFNDRLLKIMPKIGPWVLNLTDNFPWLKDALVTDANGQNKYLFNSPKDRGGNAVRMVGCRNNPAWQEFRKRWFTYVFEGTKGVADDSRYSVWPDRGRIHKALKGVFIDNAGMVPCSCDYCWKEWCAIWKQKFANRPIPFDRSIFSHYRILQTKDPEAFSLLWQFETDIASRFNKMMTEVVHKYGGVTMINVTTGGQFSNLNQIQKNVADAYLWELSGKHAPWGTAVPWYKRGLAASNGRLVTAVTYTMPPTNLDYHAMPNVTPEFTQMAMAEAFSNQCTYILSNELTPGFFPAVKQYNTFNILNQKLFRNAQAGGRVAIILAVRSGLLHGRKDSVTDNLINRLTKAGIPIEVITEEEITANLRDRFDVVIAPDLTCVTDKIVSNLLNYYEKGGGLVISKDFATKDWDCKSITNVTAKKLLDESQSAGARLAIIKDYGDNESAESLMMLLSKVTNGKLPQILESNSQADCMMNAMSHPGLKDCVSFHIVNYKYATNPVCVLRHPSQTVAWDFLVDAKQKIGKIYIYGRGLNGGCDLDVKVNGIPMPMIKAAVIGSSKNEAGYEFEQPGWIPVDVSSAVLKTVNRLELSPASGKGGFILYIDPFASNRSGYSDNGGSFSQDLTPDVAGSQMGSYIIKYANATPKGSVLTAHVVPLVGAKLKLRDYDGKWYAAVISPDKRGRSQFLETKYVDGVLTIDVPEVYIYSIIVLNQDKIVLEDLIKLNNTENLLDEFVTFNNESKPERKIQ